MGYFTFLTKHCILDVARVRHKRHMVPTEEIIKKLAAFGLSPLESNVYLYLYGKEPQSVLAVSRALSIPRTTIYDTGKLLIDKGLIERVIEYKRQKLQAFSVDILEDSIREHKEQAAKLTDNLSFLKQTLTRSIDTSAQTKVRYFHGSSGFKQMMWNALLAKTEQTGYSELGRSTIVGTAFVRHWMDEMKRRHIQDRVIINPKKETMDYMTSHSDSQYRNDYQKTRLLTEAQLAISGDTTIYNNIFAVAYWKQGEVVGVEIENPELVKTQKAIFEILWKLAKPLPKRS